MSRTQRIFDLIQMLRRHRYPIIGKCLADEVRVSLRTLYRDIATLQAQGASSTVAPESHITHPSSSQYQMGRLIIYSNYLYYDAIFVLFIEVSLGGRSEAAVT